MNRVLVRLLVALVVLAVGVPALGAVGLFMWLGLSLRGMH